MAADADLTTKDLLEWDQVDVQRWFSSIGYPQYEYQLKDNHIRGDSLCMLDSDSLKDLGVTSVGQRISILKALYYLKVDQGILLDEDDYIPPSELDRRVDIISVNDLHSTIKSQGQRLRSLEEENRTLTAVMVSFLDEIIKLRSSLGLPIEPLARIRKQLPRARDDIQANGSGRLALPAPSSQTPPSENSASNGYVTPASSAQESSDASAGNMKVSLDDPTWKVLPAALKKHRINNDDWKDYAMFISYGPPGNRTKRRLELDEKPLYLFKKLKDAKKNPAFVLKNMKELKTPAEEQPSANSSFNTTSSRDNSPVADQSQNSRFVYPVPPLSIRSNASERQL